MRTSVVLLTVALTGALGAHLIFNLPLGFAFLLFLVGWPLGGTLITIDDDLRRGWSNPNGTVRPSWLEAPFWGQITGGLAASAAGFAIDFGWRSPEGLATWLVSIAAAFLAVALLTRRWWLVAGTFGGSPSCGVKSREPANIQLEPSRPLSRAIMSPRRAAQLER